MGRFTMVTGAVTICVMLIGSNILRIFGWLASAMLTPLMILITGVFFFGFITFREELAPYSLALLAMTPTVLTVWLGFTQNILSKSTKYSLFDPTKEMCYIPLDQEAKVKGKAAVDVVGGRLGKSGGALIQQTLFFTTGLSLVELVPNSSIIVIGVITLWLYANKNLNRSLENLHQEAAIQT